MPSHTCFAFKTSPRVTSLEAEPSAPKAFLAPRSKHLSFPHSTLLPFAHHLLDILGVYQATNTRLQTGNPPTMHRTYSMRQSRAPTASQIQNPPPPSSSTKSGRFFGKSSVGELIFLQHRKLRCAQILFAIFARICILRCSGRFCCEVISV